MMKKGYLITLVLGLAVVLAGCTQAVPGGAEDVLDAVGTQLPEMQPEAVLEAQRQLSETLGVPNVDIQIIAVEPADWPDVCLGLESQGEMCAQVITPGYEVIFEYQGQRYEFRTNDTGEVIRRAQ